MSDMIVRREGGIKITRIKESDIDKHIKNNENKMNNLLSERILNSLKNYKVNMKTIYYLIIEIIEIKVFKKIKKIV